MKKFTKFFILVVIIFAIFFSFTQSVLADIGNKPSMLFNLIYETSQQIHLVSGQQIECDDKYCKRATPLPDLGPQGFFCRQDLCDSTAYGYKPYHKLVITFSDKIRESKIFTTYSFNAVFDVRITDTDLIIKETTPSFSFFKDNILPFTIALIITLIIEFIVALIFILFAKISKKVLLYIIIGNLISLPIVWFVFPLFNFNSLLMMILSEFFAIIFETYFIYLFNKQIISFRRSLILATLINAVSLVVGQFISIWLIIDKLF